MANSVELKAGTNDNNGGLDSQLIKLEKSGNRDPLLRFYKYNREHTVICPLSGCKFTMTSNMLLSHFLRDHERGTFFKVKRIYLNESIDVSIHPNMFEFANETYCMGCLLYGGERSNNTSDRPDRRGISKVNICLPPRDKKYEFFCPIFIIGSIIRPSLSSIDNNFTQNSHDSYIMVWFTSPWLRPLHVTLKFTTKSCQLNVRNSAELQNPEDVILETTDYVKINSYNSFESNFISFNLSVHENNILGFK